MEIVIYEGLKLNWVPDSFKETFIKDTLTSYNVIANDPFEDHFPAVIDLAHMMEETIMDLQAHDKEKDRFFPADFQGYMFESVVDIQTTLQHMNLTHCIKHDNARKSGLRHFTTEVW